MPFAVEIVDGVLQGGVESVVVLRGDEDERVAAGYHFAPSFGVGMRVLPEPGMRRLVEHGQVDLGEVDDLNLEAAVVGGMVGEPLRDRKSHAARPGAGNDDLENGQGHGISS